MGFDISDALCLAALASVVLGAGLVAFAFLGVLAAVGTALILAGPAMFFEARALANRAVGPARGRNPFRPDHTEWRDGEPL